MFRSERRRLARALGAAIAAALLAAGCATPVAPPAQPGAPPSSWSGRFAVTWSEPADPPREERASGRFLLREADGRTELDVFSPFGQTLARAVAGPSGAMLETSDGARHEAQSAEALTEQVLGWRVPVGRLADWLRGGPRRGVIPASFQDGGWSVSVDEADGAERPRRLTLRWPTESAGPLASRRVTIRLVVDSGDAAS